MAQRYFTVFSFADGKFRLVDKANEPYEGRA
jgi:hypothetical protein